MWWKWLVSNIFIFKQYTFKPLKGWASEVKNWKFEKKRKRICRKSDEQKIPKQRRKIFPAVVSSGKYQEFYEKESHKKNTQIKKGIPE